MRIQTIPFSEMSKQTIDIYTNVVIASRRARQIIDERVSTREPLDEVADDNYGYTELEANEDYVEQEKAVSVALEEFLGGKLEWKQELTESSDKE